MCLREPDENTDSEGGLFHSIGLYSLACITNLHESLKRRCYSIEWQVNNFWWTGSDGNGSGMQIMSEFRFILMFGVCVKSRSYDFVAQSTASARLSYVLPKN